MSKFTIQQLQTQNEGVKEDLDGLKKLNQSLVTQLEQVQEEKAEIEVFFTKKVRDLEMQLISLKQINTEKDRNSKEMNYLREENESLHAMIEDLQVEKEKISQKLIEKQQVLYQRLSQIKQLKKKDQIFGKARSPSLHAEFLPSQQDSISEESNQQVKINIIRAIQKSDLLRKIDDSKKRISSHMSRADIDFTNQLISELFMEIQYRVHSNSELQLIITRLQKHISTLEMSYQNRYIGREADEHIRRVESHLEGAKRKIEKLQIENNVLSEENDRLQMSISELRESLQSNNDNQTELLIEQLTSQLQNQKIINEKLYKRLEKQGKQLMQYEKQFFQKTEKINYLNLLLRKRQEQKAEEQGVCSQKITKIESGSDIKESKVELNAKLRQCQIQLLRYQKQNKNLQSDIRSLKKTQERFQSHLVNPSHLPRARSAYQSSLHIIDIQPQTVEEVYSLDKLVNRAQIDDKLWRIFMSKIIQKYCELYENQKFSCFEPQNIIFIGNLFKPQEMVIQMETSSSNHLFTAPQVLQVKKCGQLSMVWNLGTIIDYILNKQPFFRSTEQIKKFTGYYRNKNLQRTGQQRRFELKPKEIQDILVNMINPFPTLRSTIQNCAQRLLNLLYS